MEVIDLYPGGFACACYLVCEGRDAVLIDGSAQPAAVEAVLSGRGARLSAILCTHGHFDHLLTADKLREHFGVPLLLHEADAEMPTDASKNAFATFFGSNRVWRPADRLFGDREQLTFGSLAIEALHTPGHSRGSSVFLCKSIAFTGDTLFANGYGRTDLYGGDPLSLRRSLQRLSELDGSLRIYPGHGESTTLSQALKQLF